VLEAPGRRGVNYLFEMIGLHPAAPGPREGRGGLLVKTLLERLHLVEVPEAGEEMEQRQPVGARSDSVE